MSALRTRIARLLAVLFAFVAFRSSASAEDGVRVDSVSMTVRSLERSVEFYRGVLGFEMAGQREAEGEAWEQLLGVFPVRMRIARLRLGQEEIELMEFVTPRGRPFDEGSRSNDRWFQHLAIVVSDMDAAYDRVAKAGVEHVSPRPQTLPVSNAAAGGIRAFYFRDPDGHALELISYPPDKGARRWHEFRSALFLGIDHTAIASGDTEASLAFYRDRLGMRVVGESFNHGTEQARLNAVRGAELRITALRGTSGVGVELLEYLQPSNGRPFPAAAASNDLSHWRIRMAAGPGSELTRYGSPVRFEPGSSPFSQAVSLKDPDGHTVEVVAR